jgi:hypothetical protein
MLARGNDLTVIAGEVSLFLPFDFGNANRTGGDRSPSIRPSSPFGLSAVSKCISKRLSCSLAVASFPPPTYRGVKATFRWLCGTTRPSDSSRPFVVSSFRPRQLPLSRGGREVSPGKGHGTSPDHRRLYSFPPTDIGLRMLMVSSPTGHKPHRRFALRSVPGFTLGFHRTSPRGLSRALPLKGPGAPGRRPCLLGVGFPPSGSQEDFHLPFRAHAGRTMQRTRFARR